MSMQAQIRQWVDEALHAVLDPLFVRLNELEEKVEAFEQADSDNSKRAAAPAPAKASPSHDRPVRAQSATGRGTASGAKPVSGK